LGVQLGLIKNQTNQHFAHIALCTYLIGSFHSSLRQAEGTAVLKWNLNEITDNRWQFNAIGQGAIM
jgi:hypothetical protein